MKLTVNNENVKKNGIKILNKKIYKVQVEVLQEVLLDFSEVGITRDKFESLPFKEKEQIIKRYSKLGNDPFEQYTDIEVLSKV